MTLTLGRASGLELRADRPGIAHQGNRVTFNFNIRPSTLAEAKVRRQQVLGIAGNIDEPVIPVIVSEDSDYDGFYRPTSVSVSPTSLYTTNKLLRGTATLERVTGGYANPAFETRYLSAGINKTHSVTNTGRLAVPEGADFDDGPDSIGIGTNTTTDSGDIRYWTLSSPPHDAWLRHYIAAANFYAGSAVFEVQSGGTWYPVVGRQLPAGFEGAWRLTNGITRITPASGWVYSIEAYDGSSWNEVLEAERGQMNLGVTWQANDTGVEDPNDRLGGGVATAWATPVILHNSSTFVSIMLPQWAGQEVLSIRRGESWVTWRLDINDTEYLGIGSTSAIACTDNTHYIIRTSADGNGHKFWMAYPQGTGTDATNARVYHTSTLGSAEFKVGWDFTSGAGEPDAAYTSMMSEQRVVIR